MGKKTVCPITRAEFRENAKPVTIKIGDDSLEAVVKEFATGSLGWYLNGKTKIEVNGVRVPVQIGLNLPSSAARSCRRMSSTRARPPTPTAPRTPDDRCPSVRGRVDRNDPGLRTGARWSRR